MRIYKITNRNIYRNLSFSIFIVVSFFLTFLYFKSFTAVDINFTLAAVIFLSPLIIVIFLMIDYLNNANYVFCFFDDRIEISANSFNDSKKKVFMKHDIKKVNIYACPSIIRGSKLKLFPFEQFHYVEIYISDVEKYYISSLSDYLLHENIQNENLLNEKITFVKRGFFELGYLVNSIIIDKLE